MNLKHGPLLNGQFIHFSPFSYFFLFLFLHFFEKYVLLFYGKKNFSLNNRKVYGHFVIWWNSHKDPILLKFTSTLFQCFTPFLSTTCFNESTFNRLRSIHYKSSYYLRHHIYSILWRNVVTSNIDRFYLKKALKKS